MMIEREAMRAFGHETWIIFRNTPLGITGERGWDSSWSVASSGSKEVPVGNDAPSGQAEAPMLGLNW